jgi:hypothetical protein
MDSGRISFEAMEDTSDSGEDVRMLIGLDDMAGLKASGSSSPHPSDMVYACGNRQQGKGMHQVFDQICKDYEIYEEECENFEADLLRER